MKLWQHPRGMALLCGAAVVACAAAPALFLAAVDTALLGRSAVVENAYRAPTPSGEDYYILRQLTARQQQQSMTDVQPQAPVDPLDLKMYIGAQNSLESMTPLYDYRETSTELLQSLAADGVISPEWANQAGTWPEETQTYTYGGKEYALDSPYYGIDSLGFVTLKRFSLESDTQEGNSLTGDALCTVFSMTLDSRTGAVTQLWISIPQQEGTMPPTPSEAGLRAFAAQAGLESLGDWEEPENSAYPHALYSHNGQALITTTVRPYEYATWSGGSAIIQKRWFLSLSLQPCAEEELPVQLTDPE